MTRCQTLTYFAAPCAVAGCPGYQQPVHVVEDKFYCPQHCPEHGRKDEADGTRPQH